MANVFGINSYLSTICINRYLAIEDLKEIQRWGIRLTPNSARIDNNGPDEMEKYLSGEESFEFRESGEEAVDILRALVGKKPFATHLNYPNEGQILGLPKRAVVETNALLSGDDVTPLCTGELPDEVESMVERHVTNQETLIEAGFTGDLDLAFQAFLNQPLVTVQREEARELFAELVNLEAPTSRITFSTRPSLVTRSTVQMRVERSSRRRRSRARNRPPGGG